MKYAAEERPVQGALSKQLNRFAKKKERFWELDFLRGLCVVLMILDHFMFCISYVAPYVNDVLGTGVFENSYAFAELFDESAFIESCRFIVRCMFFALCGVSCTLSKNNFFRFVPLAAVAVLINVACAVLDAAGFGGFTVIFGVFHMLASSVLAFALLDGAVSLALLLIKDNKKREAAEPFARFLPGLCGLALLFAFFSQWGALSSYGGLHLVSNVPASGDHTADLITGIFVETKNSAYAGTADYFPLLPWGAIVLAGSLVGRGIYHTFAKNALKPLDGAWNAGFCFIGRHAALFYLGQLVALPALIALGGIIDFIF